MPRRIANTTLNASTIDILNVIRTNATAEYQASVPVVTEETQIPEVGAILLGYPGLANQFVSALMNRIAKVVIDSAVFNNPYEPLKKGELVYGETVEQIFVEMAKPYQFSEEKAEARELKRYLPDVKAAFHAINWRVLYPITIEEEQLRQAFLSLNGVQDMIAKIVNSVYTGAQYDEFLLFKYLIIKSVTKGKMYPVAVNDTDIRNAAIAFRGVSNLVEFPSDKYTALRVKNTTPKRNQVIFMDSMFNAQFDVNILASAFHMDKADFMGRLHLIDDFSTFDNERFAEIRKQSNGLEEVTDAELAIMQDVIGVFGDSDWFQFYDNLTRMTEKYVAAGLRWNYFYHTWKTISSSPFHNMIVFVKDSQGIVAPATALTYTVQSVDKDENGNSVYNLVLTSATGNGAFAGLNYTFVQTEDATEKMVGVTPYGSIVVPTATPAITTVDLEVVCGAITYEATATLANLAPGATLSFSQAD